MLSPIHQSVAVTQWIEQRIDIELEENPNLDIERRKAELIDDVRHKTRFNAQGETAEEFWQRNWKCGVASQSWAKTIAVIDIVKGTFGLIFAAYLAFSIFRLMSITPDFDTLKRRMSRTHFIYVFAIGRTGWGVVLFICGLAFWNFFLIVFGKILFDAATVKNVGKLRLWCGYCAISILVSIGLYVRMWLTSSECSENRLCREQQYNYWGIWIVVKLCYLFLFIPTVYTFAVVQSFCNELTPKRPSRRRRSRNQPQAASRTESMDLI